jgi:hypothetical protein
LEHLNTTPGIGSRTFATMGGRNYYYVSDEGKKELIIRFDFIWNIEELALLLIRLIS